MDEIFLYYNKKMSFLYFIFSFFIVVFAFWYLYEHYATISSLEKSIFILSIPLFFFGIIMSFRQLLHRGPVFKISIDGITEYPYGLLVWKDVRRVLFSRTRLGLHIFIEPIYPKDYFGNSIFKKNIHINPGDFTKKSMKAVYEFFENNIKDKLM